jgi:hypothetical protein
LCPGIKIYWKFSYLLLYDFEARHPFFSKTTFRDINLHKSEYFKNPLFSKKLRSWPMLQRKLQCCGSRSDKKVRIRMFGTGYWNWHILIFFCAELWISVMNTWTWIHVRKNLSKIFMDPDPEPNPANLKSRIRTKNARIRNTGKLEDCRNNTVITVMYITVNHAWKI